MNIVACRDREQSLNAMWRAYLAVTALTDPNNTEKSPAIVGHAFLNARYYDGQRDVAAPDGGHRGARDGRTDAWHCHQPLAAHVLAGQRLDFGRDLVDALIEAAPIGGQGLRAVRLLGPLSDHRRYNFPR